MSGVDSDTRYCGAKPTREKGQMAPDLGSAMQAWNQPNVAGRSGMTALLVGAIPTSLRSTWSSYLGHFAHARNYRLRQRLHQRFGWLKDFA